MRITKRKKAKLQKMFIKKIIIAVLVFFVIVLAQATWSVYKKSEYANMHKAKAQIELETLKKRADILKEEVDTILTDRGIESEIRERFDVGHEGEKMVVLLDAPKPEKSKVEVESTLWERLKNLF